MISVDITATILRVVIGVTMFLHGWGHAFRGGKIKGTAGWFESMGLRPGRVHALMATVTEIGAGVLLVLGLLTPLAAGAVISTMVVAWLTSHRKNGFFIFNSGQGYEYVLMISAVCAAIGALGAGRLSIDNAVGFDITGWGGLALALLLGVGGAVALLVACWRPEPSVAPAAAVTADE